MEKLTRKQENLIKIEVNDEGDFITINLSDTDFPLRFHLMHDSILEKMKELETQKENIEKMEIREQLRHRSDLQKRIAADVDMLFGENTCRKVFGDITPDIYSIMEFFEEVVPIISKYGKKRNQAIESRYSAKRRGSR